ncbi:ankyrin repeat [Fusarium phyllophilum]|uniref:Ankyrin repeat n=1 Tax=Fusarium phyllophilum TaxID=47803 RepID=A0A8H5I704_9HYPO|nr:ankyrin repeat [Fusarium phyllophilum]
MPLREKLKRIFHHRNEGDASESPIEAPSEEQQSSQSINTRSSHVARIETSGVSPPVPASDDPNAPEEAPDEELLAPKESGNSIRQLWAGAYQSLRDEEDAPVQTFEDQIRRNFPDIADRMSSDENTKDWMSKVVQTQMDQLKRDTLKLRFGNFEMEAQEVVNPELKSHGIYCLGWSNSVATKQASSLAKGLEHIASIIVRSSMWEDLNVRRYESATSDTLPETHAEYRRALEMLYQEVLRFQIVCYGYYSHKSVSRFALNSIKHHGWDELLGNIKYRETEFDKVSLGWRDKMYNEEWEKAEGRHQQAMSQWRTIGTDVFELRKIVEETQKDRNREKMLDWLCAVDTSVQYRAAREKYSSGTCNWLIEERDDFKTRLWEINSELVHYQILKGPLWKLRATESICDALITYYMERGERPDIETLEAALISVVSGFSAVFIVIDALDECPVLDGERQKLLNCLRRIIASMTDNLNIFCTSRAEPDIHMATRKLLDAPETAAIDLTQNREGLNRDMRLYIDSVLGTETYRWWSTGVIAKAKEVLIARADGMFQYLVCQFEVLQHCNSEASVLSALNDLPTGLDETYNRLLIGLNSKFEGQILGSLKWLALSRRRLRLKELAEIFIFRPETVTKIHKTERLFDPWAILKHFPSLVTTEEDEEWNDETDDLETMTFVRLAHFTVKEYLISERIKEIPRELWTHGIIRLAELALSMSTEGLREILFHGQFGNMWRASDRVPNFMQRPYCYTAAIESLELTKLLLQKGSWTRRFMIQEDLDLALREAAESGHIETVRFILSECTNSNNITGSALQAAAYRGHLAVMKLLLDNGADIDAHDDIFGSALEAAAKGINLAALKMLLGRGANVQEAGCPVSCLIAAYETTDHDDVTECTQALKLLLDKGADINRKCTRHGGALHAAIRAWLKEGTRAFFDFVIRHNANIELDDGHNGTPLQAACVCPNALTGSIVDDSRSKEAVLALLRLGADPNTQGGQYGNALQKACYQTQERSGVVDILLAKGAEINRKGGCYGTALHAACAKPSPEFVNILLSRGADVHIHGGEYGSVLQAATSVHHHPNETAHIVQKLLDSGADVSVPGGKFGSALQAAVLSESPIFDEESADEESTDEENADNESVEEMLLGRGADVNMQGGIYGTALQSACVRGKMKSVRLLLSYGARVNIEGGRYGTALQAACANEYGDRKQHYDLACLLIDHGADVHVQNGYLGSAWHATAAIPVHTRRAHDILKLLLDNGVDVNQCHSRHGTALQVALEHMKYDIEDRILFLVENGADVNLGAGLYGFPLQSACLAPKNHLTRLNTRGLVYLLDNCADIDVNQIGGLFGTALQAAAYEGKTEGVELLLKKRRMSTSAGEDTGAH